MHNPPSARMKWTEGGYLMRASVFVYGPPGQYGACLAALRAAGLRPLLSRDLYRGLGCAGLLLPDGGALHGPLPATEEVLLRAFVRARRPVLGIGRGLLALNLFWGGSLYDSVSGHWQPEGGLRHPGRTEGPLRQLLGPEPVLIGSHRQAVARLAPPLRALQWAPDGIVEALAHPQLPVLGLQWRPEEQPEGGAVLRHWAALLGKKPPRGLPPGAEPVV